MACALPACVLLQGGSRLTGFVLDARLAMWVVFLIFLLLLSLPFSVNAEDLGELSANPYNPDSTSNPFGAGSPFKADGINNHFSPYGNPYSNQSATNPYATDAPRLLARLSCSSGLSGSSGWFSDSANKSDQINQINEIDQFRPYGAGNP